MRVLVTGAQGMFGCTLMPILAESPHEVIVHGRSEGGQAAADLTDRGQTVAMLNRFQPDAIINLAALANVDVCEKAPQLAYLGNVRIVENLAAWIGSNGRRCHLIQISTDHVYDGVGPHDEERITLSNCYSFSKYAGELAAAVVQATILRTNFFGPSRSPTRTSFSDWIVQAVRASTQIRVFDNVMFSPLSMNGLAKVILVVLERRQAGVFNVGSLNGMSKADFAFALAETLNLSTTHIARTHDSGISLTANRPKDMRMDCTKFIRTFDVSLPTLAEEIQSMRNCYDDTNKT